ncbi:vWA domain-containing protein [Ornithinibacillus scapharcae]|uniref:vWA domain-containing protein n=1 Tax=Ornithinibacillus scapharcae TaxID=1147159 RepID=UPI0003130B2C|nr:hypothetical protein [Ornithinibacillus scapharcae]
MQAKDSLKEFDAEHHTNLIYVVSDGIETCDGDPVAVAKSLADSNAQPIINTIGFNVDSEAQAQLKEMAKISGGIFSTVNDQSDLEPEFERAQAVLDAWEEWKNDVLFDLENIGINSSFDVMSDSNEWSYKIRNQYLKLSNLFFMAKKKIL